MNQEELMDALFLPLWQALLADTGRYHDGDGARIVRQMTRAVSTCHNSADYVFAVIQERSLQAFDHHGLYDKYERLLCKELERFPSQEKR